jgi:hypothetical protein
VLEVATTYVRTGLNPARHILESPCQYVRCHCMNFFGDKLIGFYNRDEKCLLRGTNWVFK